MKNKHTWRALIGILLTIGMLLPTVACSHRRSNGAVESASESETISSRETTESVISTDTEAETETEATMGEKRDVTIQTNQVTDKIEFGSLPLGRVRADSWLEHQALLLAENITADFEKLSPDCKADGDNRSGWLGGSGENWERGPYYVRGLVALAYTLDSEPLKAQAQKWIEWTLASQTETGAFGPFAETPDKVDYWSLMPMLIALELYADATGDERVVPFLEKYFAWEYDALQKRPLSDWATERGGDNILAVYWLMERTGDRSWEKLCELLYRQTTNWSSRYDAEAWSGTYHIVNIQQSFKLFPIMFALTGEEMYLDTYYTGIENLYMASGRADGMSNGDEVNQNIFATHGSETCAVVERMFCDEIALTLLRDASIADHLEEIAYNALPQQLLPDGKGQVYFTMENQINASLGIRGFSSDGGDRSVYGAPGGFPCCVHNYQMGWPLFIASMWMTTSDGGLAVGAYGPSHVTATVGQGTNVTVTEATNYPYEETVTLHISADRTDTYPLYLRVPAWCDREQNVTVKINGHPVEGDWSIGAYFCLTAAWEDGDTVEITFPRKLTVEYGENNSVSVRLGGVLFALALDETWKRINYNPLNWNQRAGNRRYTSYAVTTTESWNMVLTDLDLQNLENSLTLTKKAIAADMTYEQANAPLVLTATARQLPTWVQTKNNTAGALPISPVDPAALSGDPVTVTLLPYAFSRLRMTMIPWTGNAAVTHKAENSISGDRLVFDNVIAPAERANDDEKVIQDIAYMLCFRMDTEIDRTFRVLINRQEIGTLTVKRGESEATMRGEGIKATHRNRVELIPTDGKALPAIDAITLTLISDSDDRFLYEAENGSLKGGAQKQGDCVTNIKAVGDAVVFPIIGCTKPGSYSIRIYYRASTGAATQTLYIDDARIATVQYPQTTDGEINSFVDIVVELPIGNHVLRLTHTESDTGCADLDSVGIKLEDEHPVDAVVGENGSGRIARLEAEKAKISGKCYSAGGHVAGIDNPGDSMTWTITVPADGEYIIRSYHCAPLGTATHTLGIDGAEEGKIRYAKAQTGWGIFSPAIYGEIRVTLTKGQHTLTVMRTQSDTGFAEVDAVEIIKE